MAKLANVIFLILCAISVSCDCLAQSDQAPIAEGLFKNARQSYSKLLKSDPRVSSLAQWEQVAEQLREVAVRHRDSEFAARAAFLLAYLSEHQYRILKMRIFLSRSIAYYNFILREFPQHQLADDALVSVGDLQRFEEKQEAAARATYLKVLKLYPTGDAALKAKERLAEVRTMAISIPTKEKDESKGFFSFLRRKKQEVVETAVILRQPHRENRPLIVIDPGHGGAEDGALGVNGLWEKDLVLKLSFGVETLLLEKLRSRVLLTRRDDTDVPLSGRTQLANEKAAALFVSVHANASVKKNATGIETYYLDNTNDASSLRLAARENKAFRRDSDDLSFILSDLIQNAKLEDSISLSHKLQDALVSNLSAHYDNIRDLGVKKAPFFVLVGAHMPCALVEVSFIDHPVEGARLATKQYQDLIAQSLYSGIRSYLVK